jgi:hypothetical protein
MLMICCNPFEDDISTITFVLDYEAGNSPFTRDNNNYLHMTLNNGTWQTVKTIYGHVYRDGLPMNTLKFGWASSHYWVLNDTLGYIVDVGLNEQYQYIAYDTTFITGFSGFEVPCVNGSSYSREDGMVNTVIAPVKSMRGDTMTILYGWYDDWKGEEKTGNFKVILD